MPCGHRAVEHAGGRHRDRREHADRVVADVRDEAAGRDAAAVLAAPRSASSSGSSWPSRRRGPSRGRRRCAAARCAPSARRRHSARPRSRSRCGRRRRPEASPAACRCRCRSPRRRLALTSTRIRSRRARWAAGPAQTEPAVSRKSIRIGAEVPGTPSMRASPAYSTVPPGVCTVTSHCMSVLSVSTRSVVVSPCALARPRSSANGTTAASMLPQFGVVSTVSLSGCSWANRKSRSTPGLEPAADDADLAGQRVRAAEAVDLPRVGRAHHREQHAVARGDVGRQVGGVEERPARGAAAHEQAGDGALHGGVWAGPSKRSVLPSEPCRARPSFRALARRASSPSRSPAAARVDPRKAGPLALRSAAYIEIDPSRNSVLSSQTLTSTALPLAASARARASAGRTSAIVRTSMPSAPKPAATSW